MTYIIVYRTKKETYRLYITKQLQKFIAHWGRVYSLFQIGNILKELPWSWMCYPVWVCHGFYISRLTKKWWPVESMALCQLDAVSRIIQGLVSQCFKYSLRRTIPNDPKHGEKRNGDWKNLWDLTLGFDWVWTKFYINFCKPSYFQNMMHKLQNIKPLPFDQYFI